MGGLSGSGVRNQINEALETSWNDIDGIGEVKGGLDRLTGGGWVGPELIESTGCQESRTCLYKGLCLI